MVLSFYPLIRRLIIVLPLHGQYTAAVEIKSLGRGTFNILSTGNVFDKQSENKIAEFFINIFSK